jgi:hypothetical protein
MPYYTPPGGEITAAYGRSLMDLPDGMMGPVPANIRMYRRPAVPPAVLARQMLTMREISPLTMTGMGILPSVNVRGIRMAIPAALAARTRRMRLDRNMQGLGGKAAAAKILIGPRGTPIVRRQPGFFMGPGGGPGGGPFQFPGYTMSGMGLGDDTLPPDIGPQPLPIPPSWLDTSQPVPPPGWFNIGKPSAPPAPPAAIAPPNVGPSRDISLGPPAGVWDMRPVAPGASAGFFDQSTMGVPNKYLAAGLAAVVGLAALRSGRKR